MVQGVYSMTGTGAWFFSRNGYFGRIGELQPLMQGNNDYEYEYDLWRTANVATLLGYQI
jgi:hypothetical protein